MMKLLQDKYEKIRGIYGAFPGFEISKYVEYLMHVSS